MPSKSCWIQFRRVLVLPVMAIMANIQPELAGLYTCQIYLPTSDSVSFFQRRPRSYCQKLTRIQSGWPGQALAKQIWSGSKTVCQNHQACFWQNDTSFPFSDSVAFFSGWPESYCANQPGSYLVLADHTRFGQDQSSPETSQCARITVTNDSEPIQIGIKLDRSGIFTRLILLLGT